MARTGELNKRITWQYLAMVSDSMGGFTGTWTVVCETWAKIMPVSTKEQRLSDKQTVTVSHIVRIRYRNPFMSSWRGYYKGRYFSIVGISNVGERNEWLDIMCKEVAG